MTGRLERRLGAGSAVSVGLGAMIGAGVFSVFAPAAAAAGDLLLVSLGVAAVVASANALSSVQLAVQYPTSGGVYVSGRARLGEWAGFAAGWGFVVGKTASCAAMAMVFAAYAVPSAWERPVAAVAVVALVALASRGIERTARVATWLVVVVLVVLAGVVLLAVGAGQAPSGGGSSGAHGVLQAAGLLFFAFAGYARVTTLAEEVRDPARTLARAVVIALAVACVVYAAVGAAALHVLGADGLAASGEPLVDVARAAGASSTGWIRVGAAAAALGALLALLTGVARTVLAMARNRDLPSWCAVVDVERSVPRRAELAVGAAVVVGVLVADLREVVGFSSFGVLLYYLVANVAAWTQDPQYRRVPRAVQVVGAAGCLVLVVTLPSTSIVAGAAVIASGLLGRWIVVRRRGG